MALANGTTPRRVTWRDSRGRNWDILVKFKTADGRVSPICITIDSADGHGLTREVLREFPFKWFTHVASEEDTVRKRHKLKTACREYKFETNGGKYRGALRLENEEIELTRKVFLQAFRTGQPTIKTVANHFGISNSAANKRIIKLRREGLLPPSRLGNKAKL